MIAKGYIELDITNMKSSVASAVTELNKIDRAGDLVQSEMNKLQSASKGVGGTFQQAAEKSKALAQQIEQVKSKTSVYKQEVTALNTIVSRSKDEQEKLSTKIEQVTGKYDKSKAKIKEVAEAHGKESEEYAKAISASEKYRNELLQLESKYEALGLEIDSSGQSITEFSTKVNNGEASISQMSRELAEAQNKAILLGGALQEAGGKLQTVGQGMSNVGGMLAIGITVPIVAAGTASVKLATDAETSFAKVSTIADETVLSYDKLKKGVTSASRDSGVEITEFNEALYSSLSAGVESGKAIEFTTGMVKLARGGFTDTAKAVDVVTSVLNAYGLSADEATSISDKLILTQNIGKTTVDELAGSLGRIIPSAKAAGVGMDDVGTTMAILTKRGIQTAEATTYYNGMLNELSKSGSIADKTLRDMSGKGFTQLVEEGKPVTEILQMLKDEAEKNGKSLADMFGSMEGGKAALSIMSDGGKEYNEVLETMKNSSGTAQTAFDKMDATPAVKMQKEFNKLKLAGIDVGAKLLPVVTQGVTLIGDLAEKFAKLSPEQQETIIKTLAFAAATGPLLKGVGAATSGIGSMTKGVGKLMENMGKKAVDDATKSVGGFAKVVGGISPVSGIALAGVAALGIGVAVAMKKAHDSAIKADLKKHFGNVSLSMEEVEDVAKRLTTRDWTVKLDAAIEAREKVAGFEAELKTTVDDLNKIDWKISVGLALTDAEKVGYKESLLSYVDQSVKYMEQQHYTANLSIDAILAPGTAENSSYKEFCDSYYNGLNSELTGLGKELSDLVNQAFEDNILTPEELSVINEKKAEIQKKLDEVAKARYDLKLSNIAASAPQSGLTADSFKSVQKQLQTEIGKRKEEIESQKVELLVPYQAELNSAKEGGDVVKIDEAQDAFEKAKVEIEEKANEELSNLNLDMVNVELGTIKTNYNTEQLAGDFKEGLKGSFNKAVSSATALGENADWSTMWEGLRVQVASGSEELSGASKEVINDMLEQMKPQTEQLEAVARQYEEAGKAVPEGIAKGLEDTYQLEMMSGNTDHMYQLLGMQMSDSPEFFDAIEKAKESGGYIPEGIAEGIQTATGQVYNEQLHLWEQTGDASELGAADAAAKASAASERVPESIRESLEKGKNPLERTAKELITGVKDPFPREDWEALGAPVGKLPTTMEEILRNGKVGVDTSAQNLVSSVKDPLAMTSWVGVGGEVGQIPVAMQSALIGGTAGVDLSARILALSAKNPFANGGWTGTGSTSGAQLGDGLGGGLYGKSGYVGAQSALLAENAKGNITNANFNRFGITEGGTLPSGIGAGIDGNKKLVDASVSKVSSTINGLSSSNFSTNTWGLDMIIGLARGITSGKSDFLVSAVTGVAGLITSMLHFTRPDVGPLRYYEEWMPHMMQGYAKGIKDNRYRIANELSETTFQMQRIMSDISMPDIDFGDFINPSIIQGEMSIKQVGQDNHVKLADEIANRIVAALQKSPISPIFRIEEGDIIMDGEKVGRTTAPVISRIISGKI